MITNLICYECGCKLETKGEFYKCTNCGMDTEKDYDRAILRGFELGFDVIKEMEKFK